MTTQINLTQLRELVHQHYRPDFIVRFNDEMASTVLALIDTAEAAIEVDATVDPDDPQGWPALQRLAETLNNYTTT